MVVRGIFKGKNGDRGFIKDHEYKLQVKHKLGGNIRVEETLAGFNCEYESFIAFMNNWDDIRKK
jgi:hypothetical protein